MVPVLVAGILSAAVASAQTFRVNNGSSATVSAAPDYAAEVKGDPWDFDKPSDYSYMYSVGEVTPQDNDNDYTAWQPWPTVQNGVFTGITREASPSLQMLFGGVPYAMNDRQDTGLRMPVDAARYVTLSFRMKRSWAAGNTELLKTIWEKGRRAVGTPSAVLLLLAKGHDADAARWINQNPVATQGAANDWQVYRVRLTDPRMLIPQRYSGTSWAGQVMGLSLALGSGPVGSTVQMDWVRLTAPRTVNLSWQSLGGSVVITATDGTQTVQVFPEDLAPRTNDPRASTGAFPDNSSVAWDYGHLTPGTWTLTAQGASTTRTATLVVDANPFFTILNPDETGGEDMATTVLGDPWDLANREDVFRYTTPSSAHFDVKNVSFGPQGMTGVAYRSIPSYPHSDSQVRFFDDDMGTKFELTPALARRYHRLTFTIDYDLPPQSTFDPLAPRPFLEDIDTRNGRPGVGGIVRATWRTAAHRGGPFAQTCGLIVQDGGPRTFTIDLSAYASGQENCVPEGLQFLPGGLAWGNLASPITNFRLDINEGVLETPFRLSNVKLAADDEPDASGQFIVQWSAQDGRYSANPSAPVGAQVALYLDTDTNPSDKRLIASGLNAATGAYIWDLGAMPGGVTPGTYHVYVEMTDAAGYSYGKYATGPLQVTRTYEAPMTLSQWQTFYGITDMNADPDGDGVSNQAEFAAGTSPHIPNRWELAEGSTGFFKERIAIANPENRSAIVRAIVLFGQRGDLGEATPPPAVIQEIPIAAYGRHTIDINSLANASYNGEGRAVSVVVESMRGGVVVERTMSFGNNDGWGAHTGKAVEAPAKQWFLAEGAANNFFQTFIMITATGTVAPTVQVDFLLESGEVVSIPANFPSAPARMTLWANQVCAPGTGDTGCVRVLDGKAFSTRITADQPISVERAMYFNKPGRQFEGGHASAAVSTPATRWFVAEGATGQNFDTYLLIANPGAQDTVATVRYLTPSGTYTQTYGVRANSRLTLYVDSELTQLSGLDALTTQVDVSADVSATHPIVVERAMYWFGSFQNWTDAHNSAGLTTTGTHWAMAEGQNGGALKYQTFVLIANPSNSAATVRMRLLREGGRPVVTSATFTVPANSRFTCYAGQPGPCKDTFAQLADNERFGTSVESVNAVPLVVEHALYWNGGGELFGAGTNETAVKIK